jgi:hypothetical protein
MNQYTLYARLQILEGKYKDASYLIKPQLRKDINNLKQELELYAKSF